MDVWNLEDTIERCCCDATRLWNRIWIDEGVCVYMTFKNRRTTREASGKSMVHLSIYLSIDI